MTKTDEEPSSRGTAYAALLAGAFVWGVIWYPYRLLNEAGVGGLLASVLTYAVALALGLFFFRRQLGELRFSWILLALALAAGGCNLGYVLGTVQGIVMRVLLLFYLAPLWTILLARFFLHERLTRTGSLIITMSLLGAATMLWHPELGAPWPTHIAEWYGLLAGFLFALSNVLIRKAHHISIEVKSLAVFMGVMLLGTTLIFLGLESLPTRVNTSAIWMLLVVGVVLLVINLVVQFGLMRTAANQAIVILLSELVFAAISSWWLAGESMGAREWLGGGMIAAASLLAARMESPAETPAASQA